MTPKLCVCAWLRCLNKDTSVFVHVCYMYAVILPGDGPQAEVTAWVEQHFHHDMSGDGKGEEGLRGLSKPGLDPCFLGSE